MSIKLSAYDTTACSGHVIDSIRDALQLAYGMGELRPDPDLLDSKMVVVVRGGHYQDQNILSFAHPIVLHTRHGHVVAVDARPYGRYESAQGEFHVRDKWSYHTLLLRGALQELWANGESELMRTFSNFPMKIFANWVGEMVAKRLAMEFSDQARLSILSGVMYQSLFIDDLAPARDPVVLGQQIVRATGMKADQVMDVVDRYPQVSDVDDYCRGAQMVTENVRTRALNPSILLQLAGAYWYGANARETIAVALEHPPTWIALLWQALADRGMRNSGLTKILDRSMFARDGELFQKQVLNLVRA
jgi:hypothetical protein